MKATPFALIVCFLVALPTSMARADDEADRNALRALKSMYETAVVDGDFTPLAPHVHESFSGVMLTSEEVRGLDGLKTYWKKMRDMMGEGATHTLELNPNDSIIEGDFAISSGTSVEKVITGAGKEYNFGTQWTAVSRRVDGQWQLLRVQGTMDPVENEFVLAAITAASVTAGLVCAIGGLILGFLLRGFFKKR